MAGVTTRRSQKERGVYTMNYIYRFLDKDGNILYIGRTIHMHERMDLHFGRQTIPRKQVPESDAWKVVKVEYTEVESKVDAALLEAYLIAVNRPQYNRHWVYKEKPTFVLEYGDLEWREWELRLDDNADHLIRIWKDGEFLYEIPKLHSVYDSLCEKLGITQDMNFPFGDLIENNGYQLRRISSKRRVVNGSMVKKPKYRYPEGEDGEHENTNENDQIGE